MWIRAKIARNRIAPIVIASEDLHFLAICVNITNALTIVIIIQQRILHCNSRLLINDAEMINNFILVIAILSLQSMAISLLRFVGMKIIS